MRVRMEPSKRTGVKSDEPVKRGKGTDCGKQLLQLLVCIGLFLTVFLGKGVFPEQVAQVGPQLLGVIRSNTDFRAAFAELGGAVANSESLPDGMKEFCVAVFGVQTVDAKEQPSTQTDVVEVLQPEPLLQEEPVVEPEPEPAPEPELILTQRSVGDVVETVAVDGESLPENYTYDHLYLGSMETANPVAGKLTSAFGYRDHPTIGRYAVHGGVDIGAPSGTDVLAFAAGTVAYVGESDDFGLYVRLDHENGVSTFYSHCQSILVEKGQQVGVGQRVAQVGSTGKSTGPHLHFEVQLGDVRLDPMHYIVLKGD